VVDRQELALPPSIKLDQVKGFSLFMMKAVINEIENSAVWQATVQTDRLPDGISQLTAHFEDEDGKSAHDTIRLINPASGQWKPAIRNPGGSENTIGAWPEHGILGTQLGPNKNGRKW